MGQALNILNAPITIWLLSSVVIGLVTWAYKSSTVKRSERRLTAALIDKAEEELYLISEELLLVVSDIASLSIKKIQYLIERTQYLPFDLAKNEYRPTLYNILLQLQSYTGDMELKNRRKEILYILRELIVLRDDHHRNGYGDTMPISLAILDDLKVDHAIEFYKKLSEQFSHTMQ